MDETADDLLNSNPDLYRHTPVRYLGYSNEVGEAFRSIIGKKWVQASYGVATLYVLADTIDKTSKTYQETQKREDCLKRTLYVTGDTLFWQMLASVFIPGYTINRLCYVSNYGLKKLEKLSKTRRNITVTAIGLLVIPFIIHPIDKVVDLLLDETYRKLAP